MEMLNVEIVEPPRSGISNVIQKIRPGWKRGDVIIKKMEEGFINQMFKCGLPEDVEQNDVIIIRVYGPGTDGYVDRERECLVMRMVHSAGLGAQVYCRFANGLAYKFHRGQTIQRNTIRNEDICRGVAKLLAALHQIDVSKCLPKLGLNANREGKQSNSMMSRRLKALLLDVPAYYDDVNKQRIREEEFPNLDDAISVVIALEAELSSMGFTQTLCHCDAHAANIVHNPVSGEVHLIDWEFAGVHYPPFDLGMYLAGFFVLNDCTEEYMALYPDKEYQLRWIRWYLEYKAELTGEDSDGITEDQVLHWYRASVNCAMQWAQVGIGFFLRKDALKHADGDNLRLARCSKRLFNFIKDNHYGC